MKRVTASRKNCEGATDEEGESAKAITLRKETTNETSRRRTEKGTKEEQRVNEKEKDETKNKKMKKNDNEQRKISVMTCVAQSVCIDVTCHLAELEPNVRKVVNDEDDAADATVIDPP